MAGKRDKPEEIVAKLRQVEVLQGQGAVDSGCGPSDWRNAADVLPMAQAIWRDGA